MLNFEKELYFDFDSSLTFEVVREYKSDQIYVENDEIYLSIIFYNFNLCIAYISAKNIF